MRTTHRAPVVAMLVLALAACAGGQGAQDVDGAPASAPPAVASPTPVAPGAAATPSETAVDGEPDGTSEPGTAAFEGSTETVSTPGFPDAEVDAVAYLTQVRAGRHPGFDRVVWTFDGPVPAYRVGYAQRPITEDGSGRPIDVDGDAVLQIIFTPASGTDLSGETPRPVYEGGRRLPGTRFGTTVVREIVETGDFEATLSWAVGLGRQAPFTVTELPDPTRVVIDVASGEDAP